MFNKQDKTRNAFMLDGKFAKKGYDWWWHSFTAIKESTGEEKQFFIEFFICNPKLGGDAPVFGQLPENKARGIKPSYLMVKAGCWGEEHCQLHRFFGINKIRLHKTAPYSVGAGDCYASDTELRGRVEVTRDEAKVHSEYMSDAGSMEWKLKLDKKIAFNVGYGAGKLFRDIKAFQMYWHAEGIKTLYSGEIIFNGERYIVTPETSFGYADKNWGCDFTDPWIWLSSCRLISRKTGNRLENSAFDIGGGKPKVFFLPLDRKLLGAFYHEGKEYEFNFSKFWTLPRTKFSITETASEIIWHIRQENRNAIMLTDITCKKSDMLLINYENPNGERVHKTLWNGGSGKGRIRLLGKRKNGLVLIDDIDALSVGCETS